MFKLDKNAAKEILVSELDFKNHEAEAYLENYPPLDDQFQPIVKLFLDKRQIRDISVMNISLTKLMETHHFHFFEALWNLNQLASNSLTEDERAKLIAFLKVPMARA